MKKTLSIMLALALILVVCFVIPAGATPGVQNGNSLSVVQPAGGAYVIVTKLASNDLDFKYGWNNSKQFASPALGYWIGVYDNTDSGYVWASENQLAEPNPKMLKLESLDTSLVSGHEYTINFFVRDTYDSEGHGISNLTIVQVNFTAP